MWLVFAVLASALWGLSYTLSEQIYRYASIYTTLAVHCLFVAVALFFVAWYQGMLRSDFAAVTSSPKTFMLFAAGVVVFLLAELFIALSITHKNATLAGFVEISYPLFIAIFAFLLFKESQLTLPTALGGLLILSGIFVIYWFSR